jgi:transcriptional regulator of acetoin/glycerol metabolism
LSGTDYREHTGSSVAAQHNRPSDEKLLPDVCMERTMESHSLSKSHAQQVEQILAIAGRSLTESAVEEVSISWLRSATEHRVDPADRVAPQILVCSEIKAHREPLEKLIFTARSEIDHLYAMIRAAGYVVLLCDVTGSVIDHRGEESEARQFAYWGTLAGRRVVGVD